MALPAHLTPDRWLSQLFSSGPAAKGGVVRRSVRDVDHIVGRDRFVAELDRRGFRAVENAGTFVIFCNREPVVPVR
ncbi:MAG: N-(5'-phosphoribosyl)anthranilate isomerase [Pseudomonadota bacterium]